MAKEMLQRSPNSSTIDETTIGCRSRESLSKSNSMLNQSRQSCDDSQSPIGAILNSERSIFTDSKKKCSKSPMEDQLGDRLSKLTSTRQPSLGSSQLTKMKGIPSGTESKCSSPNPHLARRRKSIQEDSSTAKKMLQRSANSTLDEANIGRRSRESLSKSNSMLNQSRYSSNNSQSPIGAILNSERPLFTDSKTSFSKSQMEDQFDDSLSKLASMRQLLAQSLAKDMKSQITSYGASHDIIDSITSKVKDTLETSQRTPTKGRGQEGLLPAKDQESPGVKAMLKLQLLRQAAQSELEKLEQQCFTKPYMLTTEKQSHDLSSSRAVYFKSQSPEKREPNNPKFKKGTPPITPFVENCIGNSSMLPKDLDTNPISKHNSLLELNGRQFGDIRASEKEKLEKYWTSKPFNYELTPLEEEQYKRSLESERGGSIGIFQPDSNGSPEELPQRDSLKEKSQNDASRPKNTTETKSLEEGGLGNLLDVHDLASLTEEQMRDLLKQKMLQIDMLKRQLAAHGEEAVEEIVSLGEAKEKLKESVDELLKGNEEAQKEFDRWDRYIRNHPEHIHQQKVELEKWDDEQKEKNDKALGWLRSFVPEDIWSTNLESLHTRGLPPKVAKRVWEKKVLWLCRAHKEYISKLHVAELKTKFSYQGLDLQELRAIWFSVPESFCNDHDGGKDQWRQSLLERLKEMVSKQERDQLPKSQEQHHSYKDAPAMGPFDPQSLPKQLKTMQSQAFGPSESAEDVAKLCRSRKTPADAESSIPVTPIAELIKKANSGKDESGKVDNSSSSKPSTPMSPIAVMLKQAGKVKTDIPSESPVDNSTCSKPSTPISPIAAMLKQAGKVKTDIPSKSSAENSTSSKPSTPMSPIAAMLKQAGKVKSESDDVPSKSPIPMSCHLPPSPLVAMMRKGHAVGPNPLMAELQAKLKARGES